MQEGEDSIPVCSTTPFLRFPASEESEESIIITRHIDSAERPRYIRLELTREVSAMPSYVHPHSKKAGLGPGTFMHIGAEKTDQTAIDIISYNTAVSNAHTSGNADEILGMTDRSSINWINVSGLAHTGTISTICAHFGLHPLTTEDILNTGQRPKIEDHGDYIFATLKMLYPDESDSMILYEQVSLVLGENYVITFQEGGRDVFDPIRERIRTSRGRIRSLGSDYLAYSLLDAIVDQYYVVLEKMGEHLEETEEQLVSDPTSDTLRSINSLKTEMLFLRRSVWPLRDVIAFLERGDSRFLNEATSLYFKDVYDHTIQVIDTVELYRDIISGMIDIYLSSLSNRMNEVMKVLTTFATIFIPLTFIVGIYGMNFEYMPELKWMWGYPVLWVFMVSVVASMVFYFRKRRWL